MFNRSLRRAFGSSRDDCGEGGKKGNQANRISVSGDQGNRARVCPLFSALCRAKNRVNLCVWYPRLFASNGSDTRGRRRGRTSL